MSSRMDKYQVEKPELKSRTEINKELYKSSEIENYNKIDLNSNVSVLKTDAQNIDVNLIKEMLDKRYREDLPKRKSINIEIENEETKYESVDTKEYDINQILAKAKTKQSVDYNEERLKKLRDTNYEILKNLDLEVNKSQERLSSEEELMTLINTITKLELDNKEKARKDAEDLLDFGDENEKTNEQSLDNSFYTGNLVVNDKDYEDFKDIQNDIKSNSTLIKVLITIFIIIIIVVAFFVLKKHYNWDLF